jgi:hypothetical protein
MSIIGTKRAAAAGIAIFMILLICAWAYLAAPRGGAAGPNVPQTTPIDRRGILGDYGKLPLRFESNLGQVHGAGDAQVKFLSRGLGYTLFLTGADAVLSLWTADAEGPGSRGQESGDILRMKLVGADPEVRVRGVGELPSKSNYFIGSDSSHWRSNIPNYAGVQYREVYPGVDLLYYGNQGQLEYDFIVAPGADPDVIRLGVGARHATSLHIDPSGDLVVEAKGGKVIFRKPVAYQPDPAAASAAATETGPARQQDARHSRRVAAGYRLEGGNRVRFDIGEYDRTLPLVIDPTLSYSSYLGGSEYEQGFGIAVDGSGNAYVTGCTGSPDFPVTSSSYQHGIAGGGDCGSTDGPGDAFVAKIDATGTALVYSTYLGGSGGDQGWAIATDAAGNAYVTGKTTSTDFPVTPGAFQSKVGGAHDLFVTKLNPAGSALVYSTYLGGSADDGFYRGAIAVDASGNAFVTGDTASANFPVSAGALQTSCTPCTAGSGATNSFIAKLNATGSALVYSTYLGGSGGGLGDEGKGIAVDASGNAYVTGVAESHDFPVTPGAFQTGCAQNAGSMGYVSKLNGAGSALVYSTYLCGSANTNPLAVAVDSSGSAYVTGNSGSSDFPTTPGVFQPTCPSTTPVVPCASAFVSKLNPAGSALMYSTFLGGTTQEYGNGIAVDSSGNAYVIGTTTSIDFPTTPGSFQPKCSGGCLYGDAFVTELNATGTSLLYSTLYGGAGIESGNYIALDATGNVYIVGTTDSTDLPVTPGVFQPQCGGGCGNNNYSFTDAFVAKFSFGSAANPIMTTTALGVSPTAAVAGALVTLSATVTPASGTTAPTGGVAFMDGASTLGSGNLDAAGMATYSTSSLAAGTHSITASYGGDSGYSASTSTAVSLTITAAAAPAAPTGVTATAGNAQVTLSWTAGSGAATYNIYEGTSSGGESTAAVQTGITGTSAVIGALANGTAYYFIVKAVSANGTSAASSEVVATPSAPATGGSQGGKGALGGSLLIVVALLAALRAWRARELTLSA